MKILFILDPLKNLTLHSDTSLELIRVFTRRGHICYFGLASELFALNHETYSDSRIISPKKCSVHFTFTKPARRKLSSFDAVWVRKEPPFDMNYIYMTYLLNQAAEKTAVLNHPQSIRDTNEKIASLSFPRLIPATLISGSSQQIIDFQSKLKRDIILKPLGECAGRGITVLNKNMPVHKKKKVITALTGAAQTPIVAQYFISKPSLRFDKRVFLLDGKILAAYERHFAKDNFRGNLHQGAVHRQTTLSSREKKAAALIGAWALKRRLHFVGLDFFDNHLLEVNVTCPGGLVEASQLYPEKKLFEKLALSIEKQAKQFRS